MSGGHRFRVREGRSGARLQPRLGRSRDGGQSVTEFALVIPILLLILLTVSDFGRYFAASISLESMARTAAEVAAQEYVYELGPAIVPSTDPDDYALIHRTAWQSVCDEGHDLPNATPGSGGAECSGLSTMVCVHDDSDPTCGDVYNDGGSLPPAQCGTLQPGAAPGPTRDSQGHAYVEVRVCYRFTSFFQFTIPFFDISLTPLSGDFYIERTRHFTVAEY